MPALIKLKESGRKVPLLDDIIMLSTEESYYLSCFQDLNSSRHRAAGTEPISVQDIYFYCKLNGIDNQEEAQDLFRMVKHADDVFMSWNEKTAKKG